jgi:SSS family solute:Na+ symporter
VNVHLALLLVYAVLQVLLGLWIGRRVRSSGDFFVAGRGLGPGLVFATLVAANIGAGSTVGAAGLGYRDGLSAWWWVGSAAIGSAVLAFTVGPRMRRAAAANDLRTVGDYLEHRYHTSVRVVSSILLCSGSVLILAGQLIAMSWILGVVAGVPKWAACIVGGVVATAYFAAGGLLTSAWVNTVQVCVKLLGFGIALPLVIAKAGGFAAVQAQAAPPDYWSFWQGGGSGLGYVALIAPAFVVSPGILQKLYGARDDDTVRRGVLGNAAVLCVFAVVPPMLGMIAHALHPDLTNRELALPTLLTKDLPAAIGTLGLAAVLSAELSSADAVLFALATSLSQDLYRRLLDPRATDTRMLAVVRGVAITAGVLGVAVAIVAPSVSGLLSIFYALLTVSFFVPVVAGLYVPRIGTREALAAIACGGVACGVVGVLNARGASRASPALVGLGAAILGCALVALLPRPTATRS